MTTQETTEFINRLRSSGVFEHRSLDMSSKTHKRKRESYYPDYSSSSVDRIQKKKRVQGKLKKIDDILIKRRLINCQQLDISKIIEQELMKHFREIIKRERELSFGYADLAKKEKQLIDYERVLTDRKTIIDLEKNELDRREHRLQVLEEKNRQERREVIKLSDDNDRKEVVINEKLKKLKEVNLLSNEHLFILPTEVLSVPNLDHSCLKKVNNVNARIKSIKIPWFEDRHQFFMFRKLLLRGCIGSEAEKNEIIKRCNDKQENYIYELIRVFNIKQEDIDILSAYVLNHIHD